MWPRIYKPPNFLSGSLWNTTSNKITPLFADDFYEVRLAITGESDVAPTNRFDIELDVGGGTPPVIFRQTEVFAKGAVNPQSFNISMSLFTGPDFLTNGGEIYITPLADASFWELAITIVRVYTPSPI